MSDTLERIFTGIEDEAVERAKAQLLVKTKGQIFCELMDEVCRLEDTVLFLQNQILRKRIAMAELMRIERVVESCEENDEDWGNGDRGRAALAAFLNTLDFASWFKPLDFVNHVRRQTDPPPAPLFLEYIRRNAYTICNRASVKGQLRRGNTGFQRAI